MEVLHLAGEVLIVGTHIHETVAGKVEENDFLLAGFLALECLAYCRGDGVAGFRSRDDALGLSEENSGLECVKLLDVNCFHIPILHQL